MKRDLIAIASVLALPILLNGCESRIYSLDECRRMEWAKDNSVASDYHNFHFSNCPSLTAQADTVKIDEERNQRAQRIALIEEEKRQAQAKRDAIFEAYKQEKITRDAQEAAKKEQEARDRERAAAARAEAKRLADAQFEQENRAEYKAELAKYNKNRKICGDDFRKIRIGMTLARVKQCVGSVALFSEINRKDGVVQLYRVTMPLPPEFDEGYGLSTGETYRDVNVMNGKVIFWQNSEY